MRSVAVLFVSVALALVGFPVWDQASARTPAASFVVTGVARHVDSDCLDCTGPFAWFGLWEAGTRIPTRKWSLPVDRLAHPTPPTLSPDGRWLVSSTTGRRIIVSRVDARRGRARGRVITIPIRPNWVFGLRAAWSPDGRRLVVAGEVPGASGRPGAFELGLWTVHRDGTDLRRILTSTVPASVAAPWVGRTSVPDWSIRDEIAFVGRQVAVDSPIAIWAVRPDGSGLRQLTHPSAKQVDEDPDWSPDGTRLAFRRDVVSNGEVHSEVHVLTPEGTDPGRLGLGWAPSWAPDGRSIAMLTGHSIRLTTTTGQRLARIRLRTRLPDIATPAWELQWAPLRKR